MNRTLRGRLCKLETALQGKERGQWAERAAAQWHRAFEQDPDLHGMVAELDALLQDDPNFAAAQAQVRRGEPAGPLLEAIGRAGDRARELYREIPHRLAELPVEADL